MAIAKWLSVLLLMLLSLLVRENLGYIINAKQNEDSLRFFVIGDWGGLPEFPYRTFVEKAVANRLGKLADTLDIHCLLALGDNFYFNGVKQLSDQRFKETYEDVFTAPSLHLPWYLIAGNHDHYGNVSAQIDYSSKVKRWNFPDYYYTISFKIPGPAAIVDIIMIDTVLLCGNTHDFNIVDQPGGPENVTVAEDQWKWIEDRLASSSADYLIVAGHYPVYSIAEHGPTECLLKRLQPLLYKYRVNAYMSGHDHNLQHLEYVQNNWTVQYFVSGSANFIEDSTKHKDSVPEDSSKFFWANVLSLGGFGYVEVTADEFTFTFVESNGRVLYRKEFSPRH